MWRYIFLIPRRSWQKSLLASSGFLLAACALILLSATTLTTVVQARRIISQQWRSTYDLVVLPAQDTSSPNQPIPANQFAGYDGGISIQQYQQIRAISGVAVAAPLAFLGYAQYPALTILVGPDTLTPGYYQLSWTQMAWTGQHQQVVNQQTWTFYEGPNTESCTVSAPCFVDSKTVASEAELGVTGHWTQGVGEYTEMIPDVDTFLLAAIDPEAEDQLFHLDQHVTTGRMLTAQDQLQRNRVQPTVSFNLEQGVNDNFPVLLNTSALAQQQVSLTASLMHIITPILDPNELLARYGSQALSKFPRQAIFAGPLPQARTQPNLFSAGTGLYWDGQRWQVRQFSPGALNYPLHLLNFVSTPAHLPYQPTTGPAGSTQSAYTLVPNPVQSVAGTASAGVIFRPLLPLPGTDSVLNTQVSEEGSAFTILNGTAYTPQVIGQFNGTQVADEFMHTLSALPESAYAAPSATVRYDAHGQPVLPTSVAPTSYPGGWLQPPPEALTTLAAAQQMQGNNCISVIRVRLTGMITPDEAGMRRVAQVAQAIRQQTGLSVLITLGSSPQSVLVNVPGLAQGQDGATAPVPSPGWMGESWIVPGVGLTYLNQSQTTRTLLLGAVLLVSLGYLLVTLSSLVTAQRREFGILSALGWEPWQPALLFLGEVFLLALLGGVVGLGIALLLVVILGISPSWDIVAWTLPAVLTLALLSMLVPLWQLWRVQPAAVLRAHTAIIPQRTTRFAFSISRRLPIVWSMALRNLARSPVRTCIAVGSLFLSALLLTIMLDGLLAFRQALQGTDLGAYILLQTAIPQLAGAIFALTLTFLNVADVLLLQVHERHKEIGVLHAIGWRSSIVQQLFVQEGMTLAMLGILPGCFVALFLVSFVQSTKGVSTLTVAGAAALILFMVSALATLPALTAARKTHVIDILRAE